MSGNKVIWEDLFALCGFKNPKGTPGRVIKSYRVLLLLSIKKYNASSLIFETTKSVKVARKRGLIITITLI